MNFDYFSGDHTCHHFSGRMTEEASRHRLESLLHLLEISATHPGLLTSECYHIEADDKFWLNPFENSSSWVDIGGVRISRTFPSQPEFVPFSVAPAGSACDLDCQEARQHLRWMMQKEILGQDLFLIGPPGPFRRWLAFLFCELMGRPARYISLTRDTTESDLKQRREIREHSAIYEDLLVVQAAMEGHILIIEGIEKCERNVLPVLNNLLENREMLLEDGRFLVNAKRYDELAKKGSEAMMKQLQLVRAHPQFRVIALGLPVPQFPGNPLDPPLRSRFQCRDIAPPTIESHLRTLPKGIAREEVPGAWEVYERVLAALITLSSSIQSVSQVNETEKQFLPQFPDTPGLLRCMQLMVWYPHTNLTALLERVYPYRLVTEEVQQATIEVAIQKFLSQVESDFPSGHHRPERVVPVSDHLVQVEWSDSETKESTPRDMARGKNQHVGQWMSSRVMLASHEDLLAQMIQDHSVGVDLCLVGEKGQGKSTLAQQFCQYLGYAPAITMNLYQDMSARDLLQRRVTRSNGDTIWECTPLVHAAQEGLAIILDGIDRLVPATFSILQRLCQDREATLFDGTQLVRHDRYQIMQRYRSVEELTQAKIRPVHPSFRILALANRPTPTNEWLTSEVIPMFHFHVLPRLTAEETTQLLLQLFPTLDERAYIQPLLALDQQVRAQHGSEEGASLGSAEKTQGLTLRQFIRLCARWDRFPLPSTNQARLHALTEEWKEQQTLSTRWQLLHRILECTIEERDPTTPVPSIEATSTSLTIGTVSCPVHAAKRPELVPHIRFYDMPTHVRIMERMLQDYILHEPILLIGPQGVGKNMLADRLLELLDKERQYIQLHRDTSVQSLTLSPSLRDGVICWDDSALVSAVREGHCLVVDEADKAPLEVVCILKGLIEDGEMLLSNGKRILSQEKVRESMVGDVVDDAIIPIHEDFHIIVLANKQGYPFLGNDLMEELGDCFSCHFIENPDADSEMALLQFYGPDVPEAVLRRLTRVFGELRGLVDEGLLSYPYSTRELIHIVKHLQQFPEDGLVATIQNVFSFDNYDAQLLEHLTEVFHRHGLPIGAQQTVVQLPPVYALPSPVWIDQWHEQPAPPLFSTRTFPATLRGVWSFAAQHLQHPQPIARVSNRIKQFSAQMYQWEATGPLTSSYGVLKRPAKGGRVLDMCTLRDGSIHVLFNNPMKIESYDAEHKQFIRWDLVPHLRYASMPNMTELPFRMHLLPLRHSDRVGVYVPAFELLLVLSPSTGHVEVWELAEQAQATALYNDIIYMGYRQPLAPGQKEAKERTVVHRAWADEDRFVLMEPGSDHFRVISFSPAGCEMSWCHSPSHRWVQMALLAFPTALLIDEEQVAHALHWSSSQVTLTRWKSEKKVNHSVYSTCGAPELMLSRPESWITRTSALLPPHQPMDLFDHPRSEAQLEASSVLQTFPLLYQDTPHLLHVTRARASEDVRMLEVVDVQQGQYQMIPLPPSPSSSLDSLVASEGRVWVEELPGGRICLMEESGLIRVMEVVRSYLHESLKQWKQMLGLPFDPQEVDTLASQGLQLTFEYDGEREATGPSEGRPTDGHEHHGGDTWQEGTGGVNTPGAGGKGGPYRRQGKFDVYQISDEQKQKISEEAAQARREMAAELKQKKLAALDMSEFSAAQYDRFYDSVRLQVSQLRVIMEAVRAKQKERAWLRHKTQGELDDTKLVDGLVGERNVYKQRGEVPPSAASFQQKPKRLHFAMDVSGSMYRFNGQDRRLDRMLDSVCMIMESLKGFETKYSYSIVGHSGDGPRVPFVEYEKPPEGPKERLHVLQKMKIHSEYCDSGDSTLDALQEGIKTVLEKEADDYFVFLVSDANLGRYDITPQDITEQLLANKKVNCYAIFLASVGEEGEKLAKSLPPGRGFVCLNTGTLPTIFKQIFNSSLLQQNS